MNTIQQQPSTEDYEKLGQFYLGKRYDHEKQSVTNELVLYDSRDLVTHAVCIGMTGSGKTGLCISLLEEAAIDQIPVLAIDPKGDLANLLLTFPDLSAKSFEPWVDPDEARRQGLTKEALAEQSACAWREGLADWGQSAERIARLRDSAEFAVYTPASTAGRPLSIVRSFARPSEDVLEDRDLLREQVSGTVTGLLSLLEIDADPLKSREHILLSAIINHEWSAGRDVDLHGLISLIQEPPVKQLGALALNSFFPAKDRFELAMTLNNLLAAPAFASWLEGEQLDIDKLLWSEEGKPRVSILSIAHLSDSERMFFVSLLLTQLLAWMRKQSGTSSLRAVFFMDEIVGYFPPVANPPSKKPLLTLLKQARAFGLGIVLATQNPVDLDYKGLANTGTWFIGRLQTERDKARVIEGLESAADAGGRGFDRAQLDRLLSALGKRVFLMNNIHESQPILLKTRATLSFLRGPLSRQQLRTLSQTKQGSNDKQGLPESKNTSASSESKPYSTAKPILPAEIAQRFVPVRSLLPPDSKLIYKPMLLGIAQVRFVDAKSGTDMIKPVSFMTLLKDKVPVTWDKAFALTLSPTDLQDGPAGNIEFAALPAEASIAAQYAKWSKEYLTWLYNTQKLDLFSCPNNIKLHFVAWTHLTSSPGESERDFRIRLAQTMHEERDRQVDALRAKFSEKLSALQTRLMRAQQALDKQIGQSQEKQMDSTLAIGSTILGAFMGRKALSATNIRRASSAAGKVARAGREKADVERAEEVVGDFQERITDMELEFQDEVAKLEKKLDPYNCRLELTTVSPKKTNISLSFFCLAWAPCVRQSDGRITTGW